MSEEDTRKMMQMMLTPPGSDSCPMCHKPFNAVRQKKKPMKELLSNEEMRILEKLEILVLRKKHFLDCVEDILR